MSKTVNPFGLKPTFTDSGIVRIALVKRADKSELAHRLYDPAKLPDEMQDRLLLAGVSTVLQQRASQDDVMDKFETMDKVWEAWTNGKWELERESGPRQVAAIIEVLAQVKGVSIAAIQKSWAKLSEEQKGQLKDRYSEEIAAVEAKRQESEGVDLEDLLD